MTTENKGTINLCHQTGCPDICCNDVWFMGLDRKERQAVFPEAEQVDFHSPVESYASGVYVLGQHKDQEVLYIKGPCPHLVETGCDGIRTLFCEGLIFGGKNCNKMRIKSGLEAIDRNGNIIPKIKKSFPGLSGILSLGGE